VDGQMHVMTSFNTILTGQDDGWASEPLWMWWRRENPCPFRGSNPRLPNS